MSVIREYDEIYGPGMPGPYKKHFGIRAVTGTCPYVKEWGFVRAPAPPKGGNIPDIFQTEILCAPIP